MKATSVHQEIPLLQEVRRIYLATSTRSGAAEEYLRAISGDVDDLLAYLDAHSSTGTGTAWATTPAGSEEDKAVCEVLSRLEQEGLEFSRSQKEQK
jgi:hypothetical protein